MVNSSFRDILLQFLEEKGEDPKPSEPANATPRSFQPEPSPLFTWPKQDLKTTPRFGYPVTPRRQKSDVQQKSTPPTPPPPPSEKCFSLAQLKSGEQVQVEVLLKLGAHELSPMISLTRLKKAHRRLAKLLHPDRLPKDLSADEKKRRQGQFLLLQATYETLSRALKAYENAPNGSACDSESASAEGSQRRAAA